MTSPSGEAQPVVPSPAEGTPQMPETPWSRLHPLTPLLRGGRAFLLLAALLLQGLFTAAGPGVSAALALLLLPAAAGYGYLSWRFTRWRLTGGDLLLETGVLFRRSRRVPLVRLQAVDVVRGLGARFLGLAELRLEVVGAGDAEAPLAFLGLDDAARVRLLLLRAARSIDTPVPAGAGPVEGAANGDTAGTDVRPDGDGDGDGEGQLLVDVPLGPLVGSIVLSGFVLSALVLVPVILVLALRTRGLALPVLLPVLLALGGSVLRDLQRGFGFTLHRSDDGLRIAHGLLETRTQTVPAGRVQAVRMTEPLLWRPLGWARLEVDVAGYGGGTDQQAQTATLLPVGPRAYATVLAGVVLDGLDLAAVPRSRPPRRARLLAPLAFRRLGAGATEQHLVVTSGVLAAVTVAAPWVKVQSLRLVSGPAQRRLGLTTVHVDTAGRFVRATAQHRDAAEARRMLDSGSALARRARTVDLRGSATRDQPPG